MSEDMIVYHGSDIMVAKPDILHSAERLDFGADFLCHNCQHTGRTMGKT